MIFQLLSVESAGLFRAMTETESFHRNFENIASKLILSLEREFFSTIETETLLVVSPIPTTTTSAGRPCPVPQHRGSKADMKPEAVKSSASNPLTFGQCIARTLKVLFQLFATAELCEFRLGIEKLLVQLPWLAESPAVYLIENILKHLLVLTDQNGSGFSSCREQWRVGLTEGVCYTDVSGRLKSSAKIIDRDDRESTHHVYGTLEEFQQDEALIEFFNELEGNYSRIAQQSVEHIHAEEVVLTCGFSEVVLKFFSEAAKKRKFKVFIAEAAPECSGQRLASELAERGVDSTLITDAAIFAIMARVHKLVVRADVVLADGSVITRPVCRLAAEAAHAHSVPVLVLTELFRISSRFPHDVSIDEKYSNPSRVLPYASFSPFQSRLVTRNPRFAFVPNSQVAIFVTDAGSYSSNFVYRLLRDLYGTQNVADLETKS